MGTTQPTKKQQAILDYVKQATLETGFPPSVREIAEAVGLKSSSSVHAHLKALEAKGLLHRKSSSARALVISDGSEQDVNQNTLGLKRFETAAMSATPLPLLGKIAAGQPALAEENIEDTFFLPTQIVGDNNSYLLKVSGESMIEAGILDGDYVVVKQQNTANNGDIVVALIGDEATVKTFYREDKRIRLQPQNKNINPIYPEELEILGIVSAIFRKV